MRVSTGYFGHEIDPVLRNAAEKNGWALCIGAGTSLPVFPRWLYLVQNLLLAGGNVSNETVQNLLSRFSPDALIAASSNRDGETFGEHLASALYGHLKTAAGSGWSRMAPVLAAKDIGRISGSEWTSFRDFFLSNFRDCSALQLARVVTDAIKNDLAPTSILSFNAEPLLFALIQAELASRHPGGNAPKAGLDRVTRALSSRKRERIPYIFCHGLLHVPDDPSTHVDAESTDKLVFSEDQYLQLGNAVASWQAVTFEEACMTKTIAFVGVSLSDSNMRTWLSRAHQNRRSELDAIGRGELYSSQHYWIERVPSNDLEARYIEAAVAHLGVRLVWLNEWAELGSTMDRMLRR